MEQVVYNTLKNTKEPFKTIEPNKVKLYLCGPTVYDFLHIGNFRGPIVFNLIRNWLEFTGNEVTFVYNYTDVDDQIINRANKEGVDCSVITERYIKEFEIDFKRLGLKPHTHNPRVTDHMTDIVDMISGIIKNGHAYEIDGEVFYSIESYKPYGQLSKKKLDELNAGERVEVDTKKKSPHDFVLWKPAKAGEPSWDSPWGKGRPGWHIECSAMIKAILGDTIDIHGGGIDLIFPHHENEIAQSEACNCKKYCNYWIHNEFINLGAEKMSKSLGNVITMRNFNEKYHPEIIKYLYLSAHYRTQMAVTDDKLLQTMQALNRIYTALNVAGETISKVDQDAVPDKKFNELLVRYDKKIEKALCDDFNSAEMISYIFEVTRAFNAFGISNKSKRNINQKGQSEAYVGWMKKYTDMTALFNEKPSEMLGRIDEILIEMNEIDLNKVKELIDKRNEARTNKNWDLADKLRAEIESNGVELFDGTGKGWGVKVSD